MIPLDPNELRHEGRAALELLARYWEGVSGPMSPRVQPDSKPGSVLRELAEHAPDAASDAWPQIFADIERTIIPNLTHWQHPAFAAYFPANISTASVVGELLSAGLGVNGMLWATSPAATELEIRVMDWMCHACGLPEAFLSTAPSGGGVIQGTASEATLAAMVAARHRTRRSARAAGPASPHLTLYASNQAHSSIVKGAMIAGLADDPDDRTHVRLIDVDETFAMRAEVLERQMMADVDAGRAPMFVCASIGTTSSTAIDPVPAIGHVVARVAARLAERGIAAPWLHVDAAHAGAMAICQEFRGLFAGVEHADSYCFNPHKWLLVNFDCDCFWTRDRASLTGSMSITPEYLRTQEGVTNFRDWHVPLGRRFRALKLWLVLRRYGLEMLRGYVREHVALAAWLEGQMRADLRFEIVAPRTMNLVCFRLRDSDPDRGDRRTRQLLDTLNASGDMLLTPTVLPIGGASRAVGRVCIGSSTTRREHVEAMWGRIAEAARRTV